MNRRRLISTYRGLFGVLTLAVVMFQFSVSRQHPNYNLLNFWGYFTNLSNVLAAAVFLASAIRPTAPASASLEPWRGAAVLCMTLTGVVFTVLLSGPDVLVLPSVNIVLHYLMPVVVFADWLVDPPQITLTMSQSLRWLCFPLTYIIYTMVRGQLTGWYPYPFLSPEVAGYPSVIIHSAGIFICVVILTWGIVALGNAVRSDRHRAPDAGG